MSYYNPYPVLKYFGPSFIKRISGSGDIIDYMETEKLAYSEEDVEQAVQPPVQQPPQQQVPPQRNFNPPARPVPFVYEPPPFSSGDFDGFSSYDSLLPSVPYYSKNWQNYWKSKAIQQQMGMRQAARSPARGGSGEDRLSGTLRTAYSILQMLGIRPEDIPKYVSGLFGWLSGSNNAQQQPQQVEEKKAASFAVKTAESPILDAVANVLPSAVALGLGGGGLGALYGLYRYRKNKKRGETVPNSATTDMLYGFTAGALLGSGTGIVLPAFADAVRGLSVVVES